MPTNLPCLSSDFAARIGGEDEELQSVIRALNKAVGIFNSTFAAHDTAIPLWSVLHAAGGTTAEHVLLDLSYFVNVAGRRLADLFADLVDAVERRRLSIAALAARAIVETSAAAVHAEDRIVRVIGATLPEEDGLRDLISFLHQLSAGARFDWQSWHASGESRALLLSRYEEAQSSKDEPAPDESRRAINVLTMIKRLDSRFAAFAKSLGQAECSGAVVRATYAMLSDHCHPSVGAYSLYVEHGTQTRQTFTSKPTDQMMRWFVREMLGYIAPIGNIADRALIAIGEAANNLAAQAGLGPAIQH